MTRARLDGLLLLLIGSVIFVLLGSIWERTSSASCTSAPPVYMREQIGVSKRK